MLKEKVKRQPDKSRWDRFGQKAEHERAIMVAEFHAWLVKTRIKTEQTLFTREHHQRAIAPFAQAGLDNADTPQDVPLCVLEFALQSLEVMESKRKLDLLNVYYRQAANEESDTGLMIEKGNEAEVNQLWDWFVKEQEEEAA